MGIHSRTADTLQLQAEIHSRVAYPLLQEVGEQNLRVAWKYDERSDIFVFDATGQRLAHIPSVKDANTPAGYDKLRATLKSLLQ